MTQMSKQEYNDEVLGLGPNLDPPELGAVDGEEPNTSPKPF